MQALLTIEEAMRQWKQCFVPDGLRMEDSKELWRVFQYGHRPCLKGEAARLAFDRVPKEDAVYFRPEADGTDLAAEVFPETDAAVLECMGEIFIVDRGFRWTYVHTRYPWCGPFFARSCGARRKEEG